MQSERHVTAEFAIVYRAAGRRWFTEAAAYNNAAWALIKRRCDCQPSRSLDPADSGTWCKYHEDFSAYGQRVAKRLARRLRREARHTGREGT
jgi:hypothetical protein